MSPKMIVNIAPQRNQNSASGRMYLATPGRSSVGIFGIVGVWVKLKYQRWPIHITPHRMCSQRIQKSHQSKLTNSAMAISPFFALGDGVDQKNDDDRQHDPKRDRLSQ